MLRVQLRSPPTNASLSLPPLIDESSSLRSRVGHFVVLQPGGSAAAASHSAGLLPVLLPVSAEELAACEQCTVGAWRSLLGWGSAAPLDVHLVGTAASLKLALRTVAPPQAGRHLLRALRSHRFSACPLRLPAGYLDALRAAFPSCERGALTSGILRLLSPALLPPSSARYALIVDPLALHLGPPTRTWLARALHEPPARRYCAAAAAAYDAPGSAELGLLALRLRCVRRSGWLRQAQAEA